jgi:hypothetical protein
MCGRAGVEMSDVLAAVGCNAGGLGGIHPTTRGHPNVPMFLAIGSRDDRMLEAIHQDDPTIRELPLDPAELLEIDQVRGFVVTYLVSIGLARTPYRTVTARSLTEGRWSTPVPGNANGNVLHFTVLDNVTHQYPNGSNNPEHIAMTDLLWPFFVAHPLP